MSFSLARKVLIGDRMWLDHQIIGMYITLTEFLCGRGYWKCNQSLLDENLFLIRTEDFTTDFSQHNIGTADPPLLYGTLLNMPLEAMCNGCETAN